MKVIIAGSRDNVTYDDIEDAMAVALQAGWDVTIVVSGRAPGADLFGEEWARRRGIPVEPYPADWTKYGMRAGHLRNLQMGKVGEALVAVWDGSSRGTAHMIDVMYKRGKPVLVHAPLSVQREEV